MDHHYEEDDIIVILLKKIDEKFDTLREEINQNFKLLNMRIDTLEEQMRAKNPRPKVPVLEKKEQRAERTGSAMRVNDMENTGRSERYDPLVEVRRSYRNLKKEPSRIDKNSFYEDKSAKKASYKRLNVTDYKREYEDQRIKQMNESIAISSKRDNQMSGRRGRKVRDSPAGRPQMTQKHILQNSRDFDLSPGNDFFEKKHHQLQHHNNPQPPQPPQHMQHTQQQEFYHQNQNEMSPMMMKSSHHLIQRQQQVQNKREDSRASFKRQESPGRARPPQKDIQVPIKRKQPPMNQPPLRDRTPGRDITNLKERDTSTYLFFQSYDSKVQILTNEH